VSTRQRRKDGRGSLKKKEDAPATTAAPVVEEKVKAAKPAKKSKAKAKAEKAKPVAAAAVEVAPAAEAELRMHAAPVTKAGHHGGVGAAAAATGANVNTLDKRFVSGIKMDGMGFDNVRGLTRSRFTGYTGGEVTEEEKAKLLTDAGAAKPVFATSNVSGKWWKTKALYVTHLASASVHVWCRPAAATATTPTNARCSCPARSGEPPSTGRSLVVQ
jgi:hypothetical protein